MPQHPDGLSAHSALGVSIIIPTKNHHKLLKNCIQSILSTTEYPYPFEIIIVNNRSTETETLDYLSHLSSLHQFTILQYDNTFNFSAMNNLATQHAQYDIICLLNNDIEAITSDWLREMVDLLTREKTGCVGAKLYYPDDTIQHAGVVLGINGVAGHVYKHQPKSAIGFDNHLTRTRYCSAVTAACMVVKKSIYLEVGGFDEKLTVAYNDVDFCLKVRERGYMNIWTPRAQLYHHESKSRGTHKKRTRSQQKHYRREVKYMKNKWGEHLKRDPMWHPDWPLDERWDGKLIDRDTRVSIVVTTYNGIRYLAKQLDSLLSQSWPCDIHIYDDGSTDGTIELIRQQYLSLNNVYLTVNKTRLGYVKNFERGIKDTYMLGSLYFALCDQDDMWRHNRVEKMLSALHVVTSDSPALVFSDLEMIDSNDKTIHSSYLGYRKYSLNANNPTRTLATTLGQNGVMGNTILINRAMVKSILPFPDKLHSHDYWISLVGQLTGHCFFINEPLVRYRIHSDNTSNPEDTLRHNKSRSRNFFARLSQRHYQLPYKEDTRESTLTTLLDQASNPENNIEITQNDRALIEGFLHYLKLDQNRLFLVFWMLQHGFIKKGLLHKIQFAYKLITSRKY